MTKRSGLPDLKDARELGDSLIDDFENHHDVDSIATTLSTTLRRWKNSLYSCGLVPNYMVFLLDNCYEGRELEDLFAKNNGTVQEDTWLDAALAAAEQEGFDCNLCNLTKYSRGITRGIKADPDDFHTIDELQHETLTLTELVDEQGTRFRKQIELDEDADIAQFAYFEQCMDPDDETSYNEEVVEHWHSLSAILFVPRKYSQDFLTARIPKAKQPEKTILYRMQRELDRFRQGDFPEVAKSHLARLCRLVLDMVKTDRAASRTPTYEKQAIDLIVTSSLVVDRPDLLQEAVDSSDLTWSSQAEIPLAAKLVRYDTFVKQISWHTERLQAIEMLSIGCEAPASSSLCPMRAWRVARMDDLAVELFRSLDPERVVTVLSISRHPEWFLARLWPHLRPLRGVDKVVHDFKQAMVKPLKKRSITLTLSHAVHYALSSTGSSMFDISTEDLEHWHKSKTWAWYAALKISQDATKKIKRTVRKLTELNAFFIEMGMSDQLREMAQIVSAKCKEADVRMFEAVWVPFLQSVIKKMNASGLALTAPDTTGMFTTVLEQLVLLYVQLEPPKPRAYLHTVSCSKRCEDCSALDKFLLDKDAKWSPFDMKKERRDHLELRLRRLRGPSLMVECKTEKRRVPYSLVVTKLNGEYEHQQWTKRCEKAQELMTAAVTSADELRLLLGDRHDEIVSLSKAKWSCGVSGTSIAELAKHDEPERMQLWLRSRFEPDANAQRCHQDIVDRYLSDFDGNGASDLGVQYEAWFGALHTVFPVATLSIQEHEGEQRFVVRGIRERQQGSASVTDVSRPPLAAILNVAANRALEMASPNTPKGTKRKGDALNSSERRAKRQVDVIDLSADSP